MRKEFEFESEVVAELPPGTVAFQPEYVRLLGDPQTALMLSQLVCWHLRGANPHLPTRVLRNGNWWIVLSWREWQHNLGLSRAQTRRCLTKLQNAGLIEVKVYMDKRNGTPTRHVRFPWLASGETLHETPTARELTHRIAVIGAHR
jgi:hypothetical protein